MDTKEFHDLTDQIDRAGLVGPAEIETAIKTIGTGDVAEILNGKAPWRRALAEKAIEAVASGNAPAADWLAMLAAAAPSEVRVTLERMCPTEKGSKIQIARRRRTLRDAGADVQGEVIYAAVTELDYDEVREVMATRDCYSRLLALSIDTERPVAQREAAVELAASDYDEIRMVVGLPTYASQVARSREQRANRKLGDRLGRMRRDGVDDVALAKALGLIGTEPVAAAVSNREVPFGRACVSAASEVEGELREAWLVAGAAGARRCERQAGSEIRIRSGSGYSQTSVPEALERIRRRAAEGAGK